MYNSCVRKALGTLLAVSLMLALPAWRVCAQEAGAEAESPAIDIALGDDLGSAPDAGCNCSEAAPAGDGPGYEFFGPAGLVSQHPPAVLFLSMPPETALTLPDGAERYSFKLDYANHMIRERGDGVIVDYDFETVRAGLEYRRGTRLGELSIATSLTHRGHGVLDGLIRDFHDIFDMPNALRTELASNMYRYTIVSREGLVYNGGGDVLGLGDTTVGLKHEIFNRRNGEEALAVRAQIKAPTGSASDALGSGNWDAGAGIVYQFHIEPRLRAYVNAEYIWLGEPDWQNVGYQDIVSYLFGVEQVVDNRSTFGAQYHLARNPLRTGNEEADKDASELTLTFNRRVQDNLVWTTGFHEDIGPETAPDFLVLNYLTWEFD